MKKKKVIKIELDNSNTLEIGDKIEEQKPKQFRNWLILLYDDTISYDFKEVLRIIKGQKNYAYIKHLPEETEKKPHYHVILSFDNARTKSGLSNLLGVPENYFSEIKNFRSMCRYLVHKDDDDKIQYDLNQVIVSDSFKRKYYKQFDDLECEEDIINNIYDYLSSLSVLPFHEALKELVRFVNMNCYDTLYKRYRPEFTDYLKSCCNLQ